jgi:hypothetical protein
MSKAQGFSLRGAAVPDDAPNTVPWDTLSQFILVIDRLPQRNVHEKTTRAAAVEPSHVVPVFQPP